MWVLNAFSLGMVAYPATIMVEEVEPARARSLAAEGPEGVRSAVGHGSTAAVFSAVLGVSIPENRATLSLAPGERVLVGQYSGPRLPEGATELPPGATIRWLLVTVA